MPQSVDKMILEMIMENKQVLKAIKDVNKSQDDMAKKQDGISKILTSKWLKVAGLITGVGLGIKKAFSMGEAFAEYRQGMDALARNTGQNADKIISKLKAVSKGTISNRDIMLSANRAVALNVTKDVDQMAKILDIARLRGKAMGIDTTQAFNDLVTGIGRGSPLILDNLGIITKGWAEQAKSQGKIMDSQFILNKILEQGSKDLAVAGATAVTGAEHYQQLGAVWEDIKLSAGKLFNDAILPLINGLKRLFTPSEKLRLESIQLQTTQLKSIESTKKLIDRYDELAGKSNRTKEENDELRKISVKLRDLMPEVAEGVDKLSGAYKINTDRARDATEMNERFARATLIANINETEKAVRKLSKEYKDLTVDQRIQQKEYDIIRKKMLALRDENNKLKDDTAVGRLEYQLLEQQLNQLGFGLDFLNRKLKSSHESLTTNIEAIEKAGETGIKVAPDVLKLAEAFREGEKAVNDLEKSTVETGKKGSDTLKKKTEEDKGTIEDYYTFVDNQRQLDIDKENEDYKLAMEGLKAHYQARKITRAEFLVAKEELERIHADNLKAIDLDLMDSRQNLFEEFEESIKSTVSSTTDDYLDGIAEMISGGDKFRKTFKDFIFDMIQSVAKLITKMLIMRSLMAIFGGPLSFLGFAEGTDSAPGGPAIVGEKGPELMYVPEGSRIVPNHKVDWSRIPSVPRYQEGIGSENIVNSSTRSISIENLNVQTPDAESFIDQMETLSENVNSPLFRR